MRIAVYASPPATNDEMSFAFENALFGPTSPKGLRGTRDAELHIRARLGDKPLGLFSRRPLPRLYIRGLNS